MVSLGNDLWAVAVSLRGDALFGVSQSLEENSIFVHVTFSEAGSMFED